ncbi:hypothetical protein TSTA_053000 [Talaromyces stipitatus ATCC 10500]|uniref:Uncharacterized protein n=1 Tax=Talaromyces stipitatus (strain ATCC 10500 / CBS 375.48 / QM 6759 / NRRL 1006) TaxID=441959 RepID=B8MQU7_TALSN|nr:uncharacterized protein TSTA_053000 [Talaromyces stipitatus ATCC 10500]EED12782.1 hypothetical protein TSTA_053000 [Talaromyces stipitatus ATCC 10500]
MALGAVVTPLSGENLVLQGVHQLHKAAIKPIKQRINKILKIRITRIEQLEQMADLMLQQIQSSPKDALNELLLRGFVQQIKTFASSQGERIDVLTDLKQLLESVQQDTTAIHIKTEHASKSSVITGLSSDSAILWKTYQA